MVSSSVISMVLVRQFQILSQPIILRMDGFDINQRLERIGFGKFNIIALFIVGLRDLSSASSVSIVAIIEPYLRCHWNLTYMTAAWLVLPEALTNIAGSIFIGKLSDRYGRRKTMMLTFILNSYLTLLYSLSSSLLLMAIIRGFIGLVSSSNMIAFTYAMEVLPLSKRKYMSLFKISYFVGNGLGILVGMVSLMYLTWRWAIVLAETIPIALTAVFTFYLPESPRYLIAAGKFDEAEESLQIIAEMNGIEYGYISVPGESPGAGDVGQYDKKEQESEEQTSKLEIAKRIAVVSFLQFSGFLFSGTMRFGSMQFGENSDISECGRCSTNMTYKYRWAMEVAILSSAIPLYWLIDKVTRKRTFTILLAYISACIVPFYWDIRGWPLIIMMTLICVGFTAMNMLIFVYRAEILPTKIRAFGCGISEACGKVGVCLGQIIALYVHHVDIYLSFGILHVITTVGLIISITALVETKHINLK